MSSSGSGSRRVKVIVTIPLELVLGSPLSILQFELVPASPPFTDVPDARTQRFEPSSSPTNTSTKRPVTGDPSGPRTRIATWTGSEVGDELEEGTIVTVSGRA